MNHPSFFRVLGKRSTNHIPPPIPHLGPPTRDHAPLLQTFCLLRAVTAPRAPGHAWVEKWDWQRWGGSLHESDGVCAPGWAGRPVWDLTGTALENADGLQAHQTKRGEKERREGIPQAPELHQHIPAWLTLASGLCFCTRARGEGIETGPMLFLTSTHFKLSFHRFGQRVFIKPRMNMNTNWY